jgi:hypothetical protein
MPETSPKGTAVPELICPSVDACNAFGIRRNGTAASIADSNNYSFLKGPQFRDTKVSTYSGETPTSPIDEVILEFVGNKPVSIKPKRDGAIVKMEIDPKDIDNSLYTIKIAPNTTDWLNFNFGHEWSEGDGIMAKILDTIAGLVDSASGIINTAQNATGSRQPRRKVTLDKQDTYQKTDKVEFNIPFLLFSSGYGKYNVDGSGNPIKQWVEDVYQPLMVITALSHPKRQTGVVTFGKNKDGTANNVEAGDNPSDAIRANQQSNSGGNESTGDELQRNAVEFLSSYPGMRVAISEPPSYVRVRHSSGFFNYNVCAIKSFKYAFKGPWVKAYSLTNRKVFENDKQLMKITLPMVVECELGIKVIEKMYADDYIEMFRNSPIITAGDSGAVVDGIVKVYPNQEGTPATQQPASPAP